MKEIKGNGNPADPSVWFDLSAARARSARMKPFTVKNIKAVLVTGAAGGLGQSVTGILRAQGIRVRALVQASDDIGALGLDNTDIVRGSVDDPHAVAQGLRDVDGVVNCAALLPRDLHLPARFFHQVNVQGAVNVLTQAARHGVREAIFFSTISVVDHNSRHVPMAEIQEYVRQPVDPYLASKINLEKALQARAPFFPGRITVVRPAFIYGPGNYAIWEQPLMLLEQGKMALIGKGDVHLPLIFAEDIACFILHLFSVPSEREPFAIYVLASHEVTTLRQIFNFIADSLKVKRPSTLPYWPVRLAAACVDLLPYKLRIGRIQYLTKARVKQYSLGYDLSGVMNPPPLGFVPPTRYREGLTRMLDDYVGRRQRDGQKQAA
jgi:nucleoside-diphosphate-sugar epimerase